MTDSILTNEAPITVEDGCAPHLRELDISVSQMLANIDTKNEKLQKAIAFLRIYFESHYNEPFSIYCRRQCAMFTQSSTD